MIAKIERSASATSTAEELARFRERLARERKTRLEAEAIAEKTTREMYDLLHESKRKEEELRLLQSLALAISEATDLTDALGLTLRKVAEATSWAFGQAWTPRAEAGVLECSPAFYSNTEAIGDFRALSRDTTFSPGVGLPGRAWSSKNPHWVRDVTIDPNFPRLDVAKQSGLKAGVGIPVLAGDEVVAVLEFFMLEDRAEDDRLIKLISTVATQLGSFIQRRRAEDALRESEELATTLNSIGDAVIATDAWGRVVRMNPVAEHLTGWALADAKGRELSAVLPLFDENTREPVESPVGRVLREGKMVELSNCTGLLARDGTKRSIADSAAPIRDASGRTIGCVLVFRDLTETRKMETRLMLAERMVSVGTLAAGVAHEINNPLAYIVANLDFSAHEVQCLRPELPSNRLNEIEEAVTEARQGAERVKRIVRDLKTFSRGDDEERELIDVRPVLESCVNMAWNEIRHRARLVKDFGNVPPVEANESRLGQVFLNLLVNAAQALPVGQADRNEIRLITQTDATGRAVVEVRDTGSGIPAEILKRIFDPFFTTKPIGVGTGLGLAICHGIVTGLGGDITVESQVGKGTTFRVVLPASDREATQAKDFPEIVVGGKHARVLVIDDEPLIGKAIQRSLRRQHEVVVAESAREGLARIVSGERFDVILCDLMMPETSGMDFHAELSRAAPELVERLIFVTGGAFAPSAREFLDRVAVPRLEKPVDVNNLLALIRTMLR